MKNKKLISAILAVASIAGGVVGAQAADLEYRVMKAEDKIVDLQTTVGLFTPLTNGAGDLSAGVNENTKKNQYRSNSTQSCRPEVADTD